MRENYNWYAVYTRPKMEKKVSVSLNRANIENYCPLNRLTRSLSDRKKIILEPLFPSCVFVKVKEDELQIVKKVEGIINMFYWLGSPVIIRDVEIEMVKNFITSCTNVKLEKRLINSKDKTQTIGAIFTEEEGYGMSLNTKTVKITLASLGYSMKAEIETGSVRKVESEISSLYNLNNNISKLALSRIGANS